MVGHVVKDHHQSIGVLECMKNIIIEGIFELILEIFKLTGKKVITFFFGKSENEVFEYALAILLFSAAIYLLELMF